MASLSRRRLFSSVGRHITISGRRGHSGEEIRHVDNADGDRAEPAHAARRRRVTVSDTLDLQRPRDGVAVVRLNRPERLNAINEAMQSELTKTLADLAADRSVHAVVLTGAG